MKANINRIISIVFLVLTTAAICLFCIRNEYKAVPTVSVNIEESTTEAQQIETTTEETTTRDVSETLKIEYPDNGVITVRTDKITLKGVCDRDKPLKINSQPVELSENGEFSVEYKLNVGDNKINFTNGVVSYDYTVKYQLPLIFEISPAKDIKVDGNAEVELVALCKRDSTVWAMLGNEKIALYAVENEEGETVHYTARYKVPAASSVDKNLGKIEFNAEYGESKDKLDGGCVIVKAYQLKDIVIEQGQGEVVNPEITSGDVVNVLSPNTDHGKGRALMYVVDAQYAETCPAQTSDDLNDPCYTPQPKGTVDYVTGEFVSNEGIEYFKTLSGVKIEKKKVSSFEGYIMPSNTISTYKSYTSNGYTNAVFTMNWKVPFYSEMKEQSYHKGYQGRRFNVSSFTASYIDFTFCYTNAAEGSLDFSGSSVVSGAQWINIGNNGTTTLRVTLRNAGRFYGYKAYFSSDNRLVIQFKEKPNTSSPLVVIDPGHGGRDCGAIAANGTYESHLNLRIAAMVKSNLEAAGYRVALTRTSDVFISKDDRQLMGRNMGGDIFVSLHNNSNESPSLSGTEVYYYRANSQPLAASIHSYLASGWREVYADNPTMSARVVPGDGGVRFHPFRVIRNEECPSVLIECGYLSNPTEAEMICNDAVQQRLAKAISDGIINYFNSL